MAGYFVKMDIDLAESEEVVLLSDLTGESVDAVIGKLFRFWRWVERHGGALRGVTRLSQRVTLSRVTGVTEAFIEALENVGWLRNENGTFVIPGWDKRFSHTAREKTASAERQKRYRERKAAGDGVTSRRNDSLRNGVTKALLEPEVELEPETEPENKPPVVPQGGRSESYHPDFLAWFQAYPKHERKKDAFRAWKVAGKGIVLSTKCDRAEAVRILIAAAAEFAASDLGKSQYCPNPAAWLRQGRWDDDRSTWDRKETNAKTHRQVAQLGDA